VIFVKTWEQQDAPTQDQDSLVISWLWLFSEEHTACIIRVKAYRVRNWYSCDHPTWEVRGWGNGAHFRPLGMLGRKPAISRDWTPFLYFFLWVLMTAFFAVCLYNWGSCSPYNLQSWKWKHVPSETLKSTFTSMLWTICMKTSELSFPLAGKVSPLLSS
jgi:hypothetical protein